MRKHKIVAAGEEASEVKLFGAILQDADGKTTEAYDSAFAELPEAVRTAIEAGVVTAEVAQVKRKDGAMQYIKLQAVTAEGMPVIEGGNLEPVFEGEGEERTDTTKGRNVVNRYNYGADLAVRNALTQRLATLMEGPDKALEKAAEQLARARGWSIEKARKAIAALEDSE